MFKRAAQRAGWVFMNVALTFVVIGIVLSVVARAQGPCPGFDCPTDPPGFGETCCNGDINGDSMINIADPIALLSYLNGMGPAPAAIASSGPTGGTNLTVTLSSSLDVSGAVPIPFDVEDNDPLDEFQSGTFTPVEDGVYLVKLQLAFVNLTSSQIQLGGDLRVNTFAEAQDRRNVALSVNAQSASISKVLNLTTSDSLEAFAVASGAGTPVELNSGPVITYLQIVRLR